MVMTWRVRGGELPLSMTLVDPKLHYDQISTTQKAFSEEECSQQDDVQHMVPVSGRQIIMCGTLGCSGSCSLSVVEYGYGAGKKPATCQICGRISRTVGTSLLSRLDGQVWFPGVTHRAIKRCPEVWRKSWRIARNLIRFGTTRRVNSLGIEWERQCQPLWAPVRPASRCCNLLVSLSQVSTPLPRVVSKIG